MKIDKQLLEDIVEGFSIFSKCVGLTALGIGTVAAVLAQVAAYTAVFLAATIYTVEHLDTLLIQVSAVM